MEKLLKMLGMVGIAVLFTCCSGDYRGEARGAFGEVTVVMDSSTFQSAAANAIRQTFGGSLYTLPSPEPKYDLHFRGFDTNVQLDQLKRYKNIIVAAPLDDSSQTSAFIRGMLSDKREQQVRDGQIFAFPLKNQWYRNQWTLVMTAPSDSALAEQINNSGESLVKRLTDRELARWKAEVYDRGEQKKAEDSLMAKKGWNIRIQHDWVSARDTSYKANGRQDHFFMMRRILPTNNRWFWAWWQDDVTNISYLDSTWINAKRDSVMKQFVRGSRDSSYVVTDRRLGLKTKSITLSGSTAYETRGVWYMTHDAMAGPFANLTVYDNENNRLFMLEFGQFAPKYSKRRFVRQFRAMLRTFKVDSTWKQKSKQYK